MVNDKQTLIINLIGGPGSGKSTCASGIFYELKKRGIDCEMALEFAKDKVWEESTKTLDDQIYIFGKQFHKIWRLKDKVKVIITDSPLIVSIFYNKDKSEYFDKLVVEQYNRFNNRMYFIERNETYQENGRLQTKKEAEEIDKALKTILYENKIDFVSIKNEIAVETIVDDVLKKINSYEL